MATNPNGQPTSRLDRLSRDLNRTLLHGSRAQTTSGALRPATIVSGQQIPVEQPAAKGLAFSFEQGGASQTVLVPQDGVDQSAAAMNGVLAQPQIYFALAADTQIPTWVVHLRQFALADPPLPEQVAKLTARHQVVVHLPATVLHEIHGQGTDADVTLLRRDKTEGQALPRDSWVPALLLRFGLQVRPAVAGGGAGAPVFDISGTPQGERHYLDLLHLLPDDPPGGAPTIASVVFMAEEAPGGATEVLDTWTLARTNLTEEARPGDVSLTAGATAPVRWPFVATEGEPENGLRLLQMASISNNGGYCLRAPTRLAPKTLVVCVLLERRAGAGGCGHSVIVPMAANAVACDNQGLVPNVARFEGLQSVEIAPFVPPGHVALGWLREEPREKANDEQSFGFGTISLVDFQAMDGAGRRVVDDHSDIAISPQDQGLQGDPVPCLHTAKLNGDAQALPARSAALLLLEPEVHRARLAAHAESPTVTRAYRATLRCYDPALGESPFAPLADAGRRTVTATPGFRDVFGNVFPAMAGATLARRLYYTDALTGPAQWPGVRCQLVPSLDVGGPALTLEMAYAPCAPGEDRASRLIRLTEICNQLRGAKGDVRLTLAAAPLLQGERDITNDVLRWLGALIALEQPAKAGDPPKPEPRPAPAPLPFAYRCDAMPPVALVRFDPELKVRRTMADLLPAEEDLPSQPRLRAAIAQQIASASSRVQLAVRTAGAAPGTEQASSGEFRKIAMAFHECCSRVFRSQIGFARDLFNEHALWFIPNDLFPAPRQAVGGDWSFATARPLARTLATDVLQVPNFSNKTTAEANWHGYALEERHFVDQDTDEIARSAFRFLDLDALTPEQVTGALPPDLAVTALESKDAVARTLARCGGPSQVDSVYLVPLFEAAQDSIDATAITRLARDAFLKSLNAFYTVDTFVQLPLLKPVDGRTLAAIEGRAKVDFGAMGSGLPLPTFSDVLLKAGETRLTLLYDAPAGVKDANDPGEVPRVPPNLGALTVRLTHVQKPADTAPDPGMPTPFNRGPWLELAKAVEISWTGLGTTVPVAVRRFPARPVLTGVEATRNEPPREIRSSDVPGLSQWGWTTSFVAEGLSVDTIHGEVRYDGASQAPAQMALANGRWAPTNTLHALLVLADLGEQWAGIPKPDRMPLVAELLASLAGHLAQGRPLIPAALAAKPIDYFDITFQPAPGGSQAVISGGPRPVMPRIMPSTTDADAPGDLRLVRLQARAGENHASVLSEGGGRMCVRNFRPSLRLVRNETIHGVRLDPRLIYQCAPVEAPRESWARNAFTAPAPYPSFRYEREAGQSLKDALGSFFRGLFQDADLTSLGVEVGAALDMQRGALAVSTPYSIVPLDLAPSDAQAIADFVFYKCHELLGGTGGNVARPPEMEVALLRLHIQVTAVVNGARRELFRIDALDFELG